MPNHVVSNHCECFGVRDFSDVHVRIKLNLTNKKVLLELKVFIVKKLRKNNHAGRVKPSEMFKPFNVVGVRLSKRC